MKFADYPYKRPEIEILKIDFAAILSQFTSATSAHEQIQHIDKLNLLRRDFNTMFNLVTIRHSIDTREKFYNDEQDFFDNNLPVYEGIQAEFYKVLIESKFRKELEIKLGKQIFLIAELSLKIFKPEIIDDLVKENILCTEYMELMASAIIPFEGAERTLAELGPFIRSTDRSMRKKAVEAKWNFLNSNAEKLDIIFDKLVKARDGIAKKLGYKNYVQLGYDRMLRSDYNPGMIAQYREQILNEVVPISSELKMQQAKRLGIDELRYYDEPLLFSDGNAKPKGSPEWIIDKGKKMYEELSHETSDFISFMVEKELMDLVAKKGKATGGFCTYMPDFNSPFIFSNFNGTSTDVDVLTHEVGHAFQVYMSRNTDVMEYLWPTYEAAEIHSMSMEYFAYPWMNLFFNGDSQKYKYAHIVDSINFLPYGVAVDEFQHIIYEQPELTPAERKAAYSEIEKKYLPHRKYENNPFLSNGGAWQAQAHIFQSPFYYIDYTLALICAFQFFIKDKQNHAEAFQDYVKLCKAGGSKSFIELVQYANLRSPFDDGCVKDVLSEIKSYLYTLEPVQQ
ncbi:MAG: M3 family oligoendopeptidase [Fimbriimonadaceae bacterium]|nr:M3 family oligoendopeptidase [Chitinophagales bacterium]